MVGMQRIDDREADLTRADHEHPHRARSVLRCIADIGATGTVGCVRVLTILVLAGTLAVAAGSVAGSDSGQAAESAFRRTFVARAFEAPVLVTNAPGDPRAIYVLEQSGRIIRVASGRRTVFLDVRSLVNFGGERGLLGLAFHPGYAKNRLFYVAYTTSNQNIVARYRSRGTRALPGSARILLQVDDPYGNHNGGHLAFGKDGLLYTSIGDGGAGGDPEDRAQNPSSQFGKLLTLNVSQPNAQWQIAALGLRNPWRFSFDRANGDLYIGDVGQNAVEEVDYTPRRSPGLENYGWDMYEGSRRYEDTRARVREARHADLRVRTRRRQLHRDRRLRLPGQGEAGRARPLHPRRLLQRQRLELPRAKRQGDGRAPRAVPPRGAHVVR